jgi:hypothetical protein
MESITLNISSWIPWSWHEKRIYLHEFLGLDMKSVYIFDEVRNKVNYSKYIKTDTRIYTILYKIILKNI